MSESAKQGTDKAIGEGNLREERGAPPYADRAYAGEHEHAGGGSPSQTGTAGGTNVSAQGGSSDSGKRADNAGGGGAG
jgi:hypothetical protein